MDPLTLGLLVGAAFLGGAGGWALRDAEVQEGREIILDIERQKDELHRAQKEAKDLAQKRDFEAMVATLDSHQRRMEALAKSSEAIVSDFLMMKLTARQLFQLKKQVMAGKELSDEDRAFMKTIASARATADIPAAERRQLVDYVRDRQGDAMDRVLLDAVRSRRLGFKKQLDELQEQTVRAEAAHDHALGARKPEEEIALLKAEAEHLRSELKRSRSILMNMETVELLITKAPDLRGSKPGKRLDLILGRVLEGRTLGPKDEHYLSLLWQRYRSDFQGYKEDRA